MPRQARGIFDDAGNYIYTADFFAKHIDKYNKVVAQAGIDSPVAQNLRDKQTELLSDYGNEDFDIEPTKAAFQTFVGFLQTFGATADGKPTAAGELAFARLERDLSAFENQAEVQPENKEPEIQPAPTPEPIPNIEEIQEIRTELEKFRIRSPYFDINQYMLDRVAADVYLDMGIITADQHSQSSPQDTIDTLGSIADLQGDQAVEFSERFIDRIAGNEQLFEKAPPATLANAYAGTKTRIASGSGDKDALNVRLEKLAARMDSLSADFKDKAGYYYADTTNIADVYDGYNKMFDARAEDLDAEKDSEKITAIEQNRASLEEFIKEYDERWGLTGVKESDAPKLEKRWDDLRKRLDGVQISDDTLQLTQKYKFLDADGKPLPQFFDTKGKESVDYKKGYSLNSGGRLSRVIELAKHDIALQNVAKVDEKIDDKQIESDVNERIPFKLFEIDTADKVMQGALENPEQFTDPKYLEQFVKNLGENGDEISDTGYEAAMDAQVNQTGGFLGRLKSKLKDGAKKVGGFFGKVFKPISDMDKRAKDRVTGENGDGDKRQKRIDFFLRILKGFGSAFLVSAAITTIATAAAALSGVGVAVSLAAIGVTVGIVMGAVQVSKWRKRQQAAGQPTDIKTFLKDKRMVATLGTTALASIAMIFGAAGLTQAALALGYGAMAVGGTNNAIAMYKDAKKSGMKTGESLAWSLANVIAVIGGGIGGRMTAAAGINAYNNANPENTIFQNKTTTTEIHQETTTDTKQVYNQDAVDNAQKITESWYRDNPAELQHRVDMINDYNATHSTSIDPYRAILMNADAGGRTFDNMALHVDGGGVVHSGANHNVINTEVWRAEHGFSQSEMNALKNLFAGDQINPDGLDVAMRIDHHISAINEVGAISHGDAPHYDGVLHQNTVDANGNPVYNTYADGDSVFHSETYTIVNDVPVDVVNYTPVDIPWGMGMFGISYPRTNADFQKLKDRAGSILDKIGEKEIHKPIPPKPRPEPVPIIEDEPIEPEIINDPESPEIEEIPVPPVPPKIVDDDANLVRPKKATDKNEERLEEQVKKTNPNSKAGKKKAKKHKKFAEQQKILDRVVIGDLTEDDKKVIETDGNKTLRHDAKQLEHTISKQEEAKDGAEFVITRAQAKKLDDLDAQIAKIHSKREGKSLKKSEADKLYAQQKKLEQEKRTLLNQLGGPADDVLAAAKERAFLRESLELSQNELDKLNWRHTDEMTKQEKEIHNSQLEKLNAEISSYESELAQNEKPSFRTDAETIEINAPESEPIEKEHKSKLSILNSAADKLKSTGSKLKSGFQDGVKALREINKENFGVGEYFDDEMGRQKDVRDKLGREYKADLKEQEKLRRKNQQKLAMQQYKNSHEGKF